MIDTQAQMNARRSRKKPYKSWLKDGVDGGPCSMQVVVRWLAANYASKWCDEGEGRIPKKQLLQEILDQLDHVGIRHRLAKDVASKISTLQSNYKMAREWYDVVGSQWRNAGADEAEVKKEVLRRFPYWDELHAAFNGRSTGSASTATRTITTTTTTLIPSSGEALPLTTTTTTTTHDKHGPMAISHIVHQYNLDPMAVFKNMSKDPITKTKAAPTASNVVVNAASPADTSYVMNRQHQQAAATAAVSVATAKATATTATATTASIISLSDNSQALIVSTATTTDEPISVVAYDQSPSLSSCGPESPSSCTIAPADSPPTTYARHHKRTRSSLLSDDEEDDDYEDIRSPSVSDDDDYTPTIREEREKTRRVRAKVELVKHLLDTGCSKEVIAAQLKSCP
ncbi:hypothetical protein BCR43DRAFT_527145 [Syncephalastrum racemosum]|uniref:Myb/SANT-like domain-containing protein n=1 Tax=Syncephalastrum racemosum TaxID=13706 RepID=A0A1X2H5E8_SYNRA|nr:hypothetical protein BCR43DRAFT_527145 [Syncephalastrum racemosum]